MEGLMAYFISAVYNEEQEIADLLAHVESLVSGYCICNDGSTDATVAQLYLATQMYSLVYKTIDHTGLPETVKNEALQMVPDGEWVIMLDADERFTSETIEAIREFLLGEEKNWDYVYFNQKEIIDGNHVRTFQKCKLFRKEAIRFPLNNIHADDQFEGRGTYFGWDVLHRKSTNKQILRETEYLATYKRLLAEGKIDEGRYQWLVGLHHYIIPKG
jgi:glycosyltransferase involved in cell wall biosynthesis